MRIVTCFWSVLLCGAFAACSSFGGTDGDAQTGPDAGSGSSDSSSGTSGGPVTGTAPDDSFLISVSTAPVPVIQGGNGTATITVTRGKDFHEGVTITTKDLPEGISAAPLTINGDTGDLVFSAPPSATQGTKMGSVIGTHADKQATTSATLLVRGVSGTLDQTFGTAGVAASLYAPGANPVGLAVGADGSVYLQSADMNDGSVDVNYHFSDTGVLDTGYGTSGTAGGFEPYPAVGVLQPSGGLVVAGTDPNDSTNHVNVYAKDGKHITGQTAAALPASCTNGTGAPVVYIENATVATGGDVFLGWGITGTTNRVCTTHVDASGVALSGFAGTGTLVTGNGQLVAMAVRKGSGNLVEVFQTPSGFSILQTDVTTGAPDATIGLRSFTLANTVRMQRSQQPGLVFPDDGSLIVPILTTGGLYLFKLDKTGTAAAGFGTGGLQGPFDAAGTFPSGIALQADGGILVQLYRNATLRFTPSGAPDPSFGSSGRVLNDGVRVVMHNDNRILVATHLSATAGGLMAYWP